MKTLSPRHLIPRWRRTSSTINLPEASFVKNGEPQRFALNGEALEQAIYEWRSEPTAGHFGEVLSFSIDPALRDQVRTVAKEALVRHTQVTTVQRALANDLIDDQDLAEPSHIESDAVEARREISSLRAIIRDNPRSPLALLDLAQFDLAYGKREAARRKITTALSLSPNSRIALRTMARYFVHVRDLEQAHRLISRHPRTPGDPWLMASEVALARVARQSSRFASKGLRLLKDRGAPAADLSELAGALGGADLESGHVKRARDLFRLALLRPNDNVLAQSITDHKRLGISIDTGHQGATVGSLAESQTLIQWEAQDTDLAEKHALIWHQEEPFSSRPIQFLTTLYAVQEKYALGISYAQRGLIADPDDASLITNFAYLLACSGDLEGAEALLRRPHSSRDARFESVVLATSGLIAMSRGDFELGDRLYEEAANKLSKDVNELTAAQCLAYYARSANSTNHPRAAEILDLAIQAESKSPSADAAIIIRQLGKKSLSQTNGPSGRRLSQWIFDEATQSLIKKEGITQRGAPALIISPRSISQRTSD